MTYHDPIVTLTLCRGELAVSLGERGLMVKNWGALERKLRDELFSESANRDDGHTGSSAVGDLLLTRIIDRGHSQLAGIVCKPDTRGHKHECWPTEEKWFAQ